MLNAYFKRAQRLWFRGNSSNCLASNMGKATANPVPWSSSRFHSCPQTMCRHCHRVITRVLRPCTLPPSHHPCPQTLADCHRVITRVLRPMHDTTESSPVSSDSCTMPPSHHPCCQSMHDATESSCINNMEWDVNKLTVLYHQERLCRNREGTNVASFTLHLLLSLPFA